MDKTNYRVDFTKFQSTPRTTHTLGGRVSKKNQSAVLAAADISQIRIGNSLQPPWSNQTTIMDCYRETKIRTENVLGSAQFLKTDHPSI
ncbi:hypothetical protein KIN20_002618 [Parelaphostrongylus tenuis]|uniref:Uncharacterized protein n=1 Tax=Parelaphostrongylus tenuis TaxID=148309 RepID=A0AAD5MEH1_PARTN|nr:hypothetical protein KIN20_002618 [Parelaphostrongylus tenuis]